jgi:hypothetical protein
MERIYKVTLNKQVSHCLLTRGINKLVGNRVIGNNDSSLGSIQDLKYALANNLLAKQVEELVAA